MWEHGEALLVALAGDGERLDGVPSRSLASLLAALAKARVADPGLQTLLLRAAQERAARRALTVGQAASVLSSAAASSLLWTAPALVEDLLRDMAPALLALPPASFSIQHCALLASAFAKAKVFDEAIFRHISRAVRLPERAPHEAIEIDREQGRGAREPRVGGLARDDVVASVSASQECAGIDLEDAQARIV